MKLRKLLLLLCVGSTIALLPARINAQCGGERWSVKTGSDANVGLVNLNSPVSTTIAALTSLAAPGSLPDNNRVQTTETTVWVINATLRAYQLESDLDYHLQLIDGAGHQMIAEIASPTCVNPGSPFAAGVSRARAQFDAKFTVGTSVTTVNVPVQITGVGFFDFLEGQNGVAPNGIELHPIIDILFPSTNDFVIAASPSSLTVSRGSSRNSTITSTLSGTFNSSVALSASGLPAGATATFSPTTIAAPGSGSSTLTIAANSTGATGTFNVVVTGTGGGKTHTTNVALTITASGGTTQQLLGNPGFEGGTVTTPWEASAGVIDNSTLQPAHSGSWKVWMNGYSIVHTDTLSQQVTIPANATNAMLSFWLYVYTEETTQTTAYDKLAVQIRNSSGTVLTTLANYSNLTHKAPYAQATYDVTSFKGQTIQIYLVGTEDDSLQTSFIIDDFALDVSASGTTPDFAITANPSALTVLRGSSGNTAITTTVSGGFNSSIALSVSGLPAGATTTVSPASIAAPGSGSSTLTIAANTTTPTGTYNVVVTGTGGGKTHTAAVSLTITSGGGGSTTQLLGNPGFENGAIATPWVATSGVIDSSNLQPARTGSWKAWMNGWGTPHTDTLYQQVTIPANATNATLSYWIYVYTAETTSTSTYDKLAVQIRNSSGTILTTLANYSNLSPKAPYAQATFNLTSFKGQTIQIYFVGTEDQGLQTSFIIDDFALNVTQ